MRQRIARAALGTALALGAGAAGAVAATTSTFVEYGEKGGPYGSVSYFAGDGEANRLTLSWAAAWVFEDPGAEIEPGAGCRGGGERVTCLPGATSSDFVRVYLGAGDDDLTVLPAPAPGTLFAQGGPGADTMRAPAGDGFRGPALWGDDGDDVLASARGGRLDGGPGADRVTGGAEVDELTGGSGSDELRAGAGNDVLYPGADRDPDLADGGSGRDLVSYYDTAEPLAIDMARLQAAPGDVLRSIESVVGGLGADTILGSAGPDEITGGGGNDRLDGRAGRDTLHDVGGRDRIAGGPGDDSLTGWNGDDVLMGGPGDDLLDPWTFEREDRSERIGCGGGLDAVVLYDSYEDVPAARRVVPHDCELVEIDSGYLARVRARPVIGGGFARWSLRCLRATWKGRCPVTVELRSGGRPAGRGSLTLTPRRRATLRVPLGGAGRRLARRGGRLEVALLMRTDRGGGFELGYPRRWTAEVSAAGG